MTLHSLQVAGVRWSAILRPAAYETLHNAITVSGELKTTNAHARFDKVVWYCGMQLAISV